MANRPLSPHLTVYRFAYTMTLSILHRITGVALALGLIVLVLWVVALASGAELYSRFLQCAGFWPCKVLLGLWLVAFVYHFSNGIRHLFWDAGKGLERAQARRSAFFVVIAVAVVSILLLMAFFRKGAA
ncbi:MAG: succinate dehydrogenase, cytochrome b556 subunit [Steroidobacteraceae bacterium]